MAAPASLGSERQCCFRKSVDARFVAPAGGVEEWPLHEHELLAAGLHLPLLRHRPWGWKQRSFMALLGCSSSLSVTRKAGDTSGGSALPVQILGSQLVGCHCARAPGA